MKSDQPFRGDATLAERLAPLFAASRGADAAWLRQLLSSRESVGTFASLDNELFVRGGEDTRAIAIASCARREGRTTLALLLATHAAAADPTRRVLLVDADVAHGRLGETLGVDPAGPGLGDLFTAGASGASCIHATALGNLSVAPSARAGHAVSAIAPRVLEEFLTVARSQFDLVVIDTPAAGPDRTVLSVAKVAGHAILVVRYGGPTREQASNLVEDLKRAGVDILGCVMNRREYVVPPLFYGAR